MEMLTGRRTFQGETVSHTLAAVLKDEPEWQRLPSDLPARLHELLRSCLRRKPRERLQAMGDARVLLEQYLADPEAFATTTADTSSTTPAAKTWVTRIPWVVAAFLAVALAGSYWLFQPGEGLPPATARLSIPLADGAYLFRRYGTSVLFSPEGSRIAYITSTPTGDRQLMLRWLDQWEGTALTGTGDSPYHPFFSPDGQWLGYTTRSELRKVPVRGGSSIKLCDVALSRGASWGPDDTIIFAPNPQSGLFRVAAAGGEPEPLVELDEEKQEKSQRWPQVLPGGGAVLFTSATSSDDEFDDASIEILNLSTQQRRVIYQGGTYARYINSGHILFVNGGSLFAFPFDLKTLTATGSAAPVIEGVDDSGGEGGAQYSVSRDGNLIYAAAGSNTTGTTLVWVDGQGEFKPLWDQVQEYANPELSPGGNHLAVDIDDEGNRDIWIYDLERDVPTRLTFGEGDDFQPVWSPDGNWIYYASHHETGSWEIRRIPADGSSEPESISVGENHRRPLSISPDGTRMLYFEVVSGAPDLWSVSLEGGEPEPFVVSPAINYDARFSPDGRWVAYGTNGSGQWEIYVRPADGGRGKWQISTGGIYPRWSRDGRTIYYRDPDDGAVVSVSVDTKEESIQAGRPRLLFNGPFSVSVDNRNRYAIGIDADQFVMLHRPAGSGERHDHMRVVLNWFDELRKTFPDTAEIR